jgi:hypothetical protein
MKKLLAHKDKQTTSECTNLSEETGKLKHAVHVLGLWLVV